MCNPRVVYPAHEINTHHQSSVTRDLFRLGHGHVVQYLAFQVETFSLDLRVSR